MRGRTNVSLIGLGRWGKNHLRVLHENLSNEVNLVIYDTDNDTVNYWNSFYNGLTVANSAEEAIKLTHVIGDSQFIHPQARSAVVVEIAKLIQKEHHAQNPLVYDKSINN